jgi:hypothetical protein
MHVSMCVCKRALAMGSDVSGNVTLQVFEPKIIYINRQSIDSQQTVKDSQHTVNGQSMRFTPAVCSTAVLHFGIAFENLIQGGLNQPAVLEHF